MQLLASAAVAPASVEQVQQVVRIANRHRLPLYAFSAGRNLGYGGSSLSQPGCIVVDLKRVNRILEVNAEQAYVVVQSDVNFMALYLNGSICVPALPRGASTTLRV